MSYCQIIPFENGLPKEGITFSNSWGGAARVWDSIYNAYLKNPAEPYDSWLQGCRGGSTALWDLAKRIELPMFERAVHASTFDRFYVSREDFARFAADLRQFVAKYPVTDGAEDHLPAWADWIEASEAEAVGFYPTSVGDNPWRTYNDEAFIPVALSEGRDTYRWLESLSQPTANASTQPTEIVEMTTKPPTPDNHE